MAEPSAESQGERDEAGRFLRRPEGAHPPFKEGNRQNPGGRPKSILPRLMRDYMEGKSRRELLKIIENPDSLAVQIIAAQDVLDAMDDKPKNQRTNPSRARIWEKMVGDDVQSEDAPRTRMIVEHRFVKEESDAQEEEGQGEG